MLAKLGRLVVLSATGSERTCKGWQSKAWNSAGHPFRFLLSHLWPVPILIDGRRLLRRYTRSDIFIPLQVPPVVPPGGTRSTCSASYGTRCPPWSEHHGTWSSLAGDVFYCEEDKLFQQCDGTLNCEKSRLYVQEEECFVTSFSQAIKTIVVD